MAGPGRRCVPIPVLALVLSVGGADCSLAARGSCRHAARSWSRRLAPSGSAAGGSDKFEIAMRCPRGRAMSCGAGTDFSDTVIVAVLPHEQVQQVQEFRALAPRCTQAARNAVGRRFDPAPGHRSSGSGPARHQSIEHRGRRLSGDLPIYPRIATHRRATRRSCCAPPWDYWSNAMSYTVTSLEPRCLSPGHSAFRAGTSRVHRQGGWSGASDDARVNGRSATALLGCDRTGPATRGDLGNAGGGWL
jgi:hypothetical protein